VLWLQVAFIALLYTGLMQQFVGRLADGDLGFPLVVVAVAPAIVIGLLVLTIVRTRRARRYAAEHADLLRDAEAPGAPTA
jgi:hypothetical protein